VPIRDQFPKLARFVAAVAASSVWTATLLGEQVGTEYSSVRDAEIILRFSNIESTGTSYKLGDQHPDAG
jgi:hypothetical protein